MNQAVSAPWRSVKFSPSSSPAESVNYVSAHDNLCLVDKLALSAKGATDAERESMLRTLHTVGVCEHSSLRGDQTK